MSATWQVAPTHPRLALPGITRAEAAGARHRCAPRQPVTIPGTAYCVRLAAADGMGSDGLPLAVRWGNLPFVLYLPKALLTECLTALDPALHPGNLPPDLAGALLELALAGPLEALETAGGQPILFEGLAEAGGLRQAVLPLLMADGSREWKLALGGSTPRLDALLAAWPLHPKDWSGLPLPAVLRLGSTPLPACVLHSLQPGDAILLQTAATTRAGDTALLVVSGLWGAPARRLACQWQLAGDVRPLSRDLPPGDRQTGDKGATRMTEPAAGPDDIPVNLTFEVGRVAMTLGELRRLGPGAVIELHRPVEELVEIAANGRTIGRGELVDVEGEVGVRLLRLFDGG